MGLDGVIEGLYILYFLFLAAAGFLHAFCPDDSCDKRIAPGLVLGVLCTHFALGSCEMVCTYDKTWPRWWLSKAQKAREDPNAFPTVLLFTDLLLTFALGAASRWMAGVLYDHVADTNTWAILALLTAIVGNMGCVWVRWHVSRGVRRKKIDSLSARSFPLVVLQP